MLVLDICKHFISGKCPIGRNCMQAHPAPNIITFDKTRVNCCNDFIVDECNSRKRRNRPCMYYHPPPHIKRILIRGSKINLEACRKLMMFTLPACEDYIKYGSCDNKKCQKPHPLQNHTTKNGKVYCCIMHVKSACIKTQETCKYYHVPYHVKIMMIKEVYDLYSTHSMCLIDKDKNTTKPDDATVKPTPSKCWKSVNSGGGGTTIPTKSYAASVSSEIVSSSTTETVSTETDSPFIFTEAELSSEITTATIPVCKKCDVSVETSISVSSVSTETDLPFVESVSSVSTETDLPFVESVSSVSTETVYTETDLPELSYNIQVVPITVPSVSLIPYPYPMKIKLDENIYDQHYNNMLAIHKYYSSNGLPGAWYYVDYASIEYSQKNSIPLCINYPTPVSMVYPQLPLQLPPAPPSLLSQ